MKPPQFVLPAQIGAVYYGECVYKLLLSVVLLFVIGTETFAAVSEERTETSYVTVDCTNKMDIS